MAGVQGAVHPDTIICTRLPGAPAEVPPLVFPVPGEEGPVLPPLLDPPAAATWATPLAASWWLTSFWAVERICGRNSAYQRTTSSTARPTRAATSIINQRGSSGPCRLDPSVE